MTTQKLAFDGGTPVRESPMPARIGFGPEEEKELTERTAHYRNLDSDPPYIGLCNKLFSEAFAEYQGGGFHCRLVLERVHYVYRSHLWGFLKDQR